MIAFFPTVEDANAWEVWHPEWKAIGVAQGHVTGSVLVVFEPCYSHPVVPMATAANRITLDPPQPDCLCAHAIDNWDGITHDKGCQHYHEPKRRGRPPKVRPDA